MITLLHRLPTGDVELTELDAAGRLLGDPVVVADDAWTDEVRRRAAALSRSRVAPARSAAPGRIDR